MERGEKVCAICSERQDLIQFKTTYICLSCIDYVKLVEK